MILFKRKWEERQKKERVAITTEEAWSVMVVAVCLMALLWITFWALLRADHIVTPCPRCGRFHPCAYQSIDPSRMPLRWNDRDPGP